ncbi:hypothetical protein HDU96_004909 [Phlyctochytrium bullatum]|nr:hypothetical protein HDU96_004909 [Phlyctochytrium bullatum]
MTTSHRTVSLETLPIDVARQITLHLPLTDLETLLRTSTAVVRLFRSTELSFAIAHIRRLLPPPPKFHHRKKCHSQCACALANRAALAGPDYSALPMSYSLAAFACAGFSNLNFSAVFGDSYYDWVGYSKVGPMREPRWVHDVLMAMLRLRIVSDRETEVTDMLITLAAALDSAELAAVALEWLCEPVSATNPDSEVNCKEAKTKFLVAKCAVKAANMAALSVLAFALDHECGIDPWDLPDPDDELDPDELEFDEPEEDELDPEARTSFSLEHTLWWHAQEVTVARLLLGWPLPLSPLRRAENVMLPAGPKRRQFLQANFPRNQRNLPRTALEHAVMLGEVEMFEMLVAVGADYVGLSGRAGRTPLTVAAMAGHHEIVSRLLRMDGVDAKDSPEVLVEAVRYGYASLELITELLEFGAKLDVEALNAAIGSGNVAALELFLRYCDPNATGKDGVPLHLALCAYVYDSSLRLPLGRLLLAHGANVNYRSARGETALHFALQVETAKLLLENGGDLDARDLDGRTPLHSACYSSNECDPHEHNRRRRRLFPVQTTALVVHIGTYVIFNFAALKALAMAVSLEFFGLAATVSSNGGTSAAATLAPPTEVNGANSTAVVDASKDPHSTLAVPSSPLIVAPTDCIAPAAEDDSGTAVNTGPSLASVIESVNELGTAIIAFSDLDYGLLRSVAGRMQSGDPSTLNEQLQKVEELHGKATAAKDTAEEIWGDATAAKNMAAVARDEMDAARKDADLAGEQDSSVASFEYVMLLKELALARVELVAESERLCAGRFSSAVKRKWAAAYFYATLALKTGIVGIRQLFDDIKSDDMPIALINLTLRRLEAESYLAAAADLEKEELAAQAEVDAAKEREAAARDEIVALQLEAAAAAESAF